MLKKQHKVQLRQDETFFSQSQKIHFNNFSLYWQHTQSELLFQVIVAKKTATSAAKRNEIKRKIFELLVNIRKEQQDNQKSIVIVVKNSKLIEDLTPLKNEIQSVLTK